MSDKTPANHQPTPTICTLERLDDGRLAVQRTRSGTTEPLAYFDGIDAAVGCVREWDAAPQKGTP